MPVYVMVPSNRISLVLFIQLGGDKGGGGTELELRNNTMTDESQATNPAYLTI